MKTKKTVFITLLALMLSAALLMGCAPTTAAATVPQTDTPVLYTLSNNVLTSNTEPEIAAQENDNNSTPSADTTAACGICGRQDCTDGVHCSSWNENAENQSVHAPCSTCRSDDCRGGSDCSSRNNHRNSSNHHSGHNRHHH